MTLASARRLRTLARTAAALGVALAASLAPGEARAWDPGTTHQAIVEAAVRQSRWHVAWMDNSELQRGAFSRLRVDPGALSPEVRSWFEATLRSTPEDSGARARGGPGACTGADAPTETNRHCVTGDAWELDALGWLRFGVFLEASPRGRLSAHFLDRDDPSAPTWSDRSARRERATGQLAASGSVSVASVLSGARAERGQSAVARVDDPNDPLSLPALERHLRFASLAADPDDRDHHLALALVVSGALLHLTGDLAMPEHARGDLAAFFAPISRTPGDRGSVLQEWARLRHARVVPLPIANAVQPAATTSADMADMADTTSDPHALLFGAGGVATLARTHFLSPGTLPRPRALDAELDPGAAALALLGDDHGLHPDELVGATLSSWPAERGYVLNGEGRALCAFELDDDGFVQAFVDDAVRRDQAAHLLPAAVRASAAHLDAVFASWPATRELAEGRAVELTLDERHADPVLHVMREDAQGGRTLIQTLPMRANDANRVHGLSAPSDASRTVLVLEHTLADGTRVTAERVHGG